MFTRSFRVLEEKISLLELGLTAQFESCDSVEMRLNDLSAKVNGVWNYHIDNLVDKTGNNAAKLETIQCEVRSLASKVDALGNLDDHVSELDKNLRECLENITERNTEIVMLMKGAVEQITDKKIAQVVANITLLETNLIGNMTRVEAVVAGLTPLCGSSSTRPLDYSRFDNDADDTDDDMEEAQPKMKEEREEERLPRRGQGCPTAPDCEGKAVPASAKKNG